jgi:hypothetical protein
VGGKWQVPKKLKSTNQQISCYDKEGNIVIQTEFRTKSGGR